MKNLRWGFLIFMLSIIVSCSTTPLDSKDTKNSVREDHPRTFNQFKNEWDY